MITRSAPILVVGDEQGNGNLVLGLLGKYFANAFLSCDPASHAADVARIKPVVLVLAFSTLEASRQFMQEVPSMDGTLRRRPHSSIVLCDKHDVQAAFELCRSRCFDDYVLFWPVTHDGARLPMAVVQALRIAELKAAAHGEEVVEPEPAEPPKPAVATGSTRRSERDAVVAAMRRMLASSPYSGAEEGTATPEAQRLARRIEPCTVLFVDDDPEQHNILGLMLAGTELKPRFADTAARAMQMLDELQPGVILVDVNLPDGSGVDLIRSIKSNEVFADTPIITVTGHRTRAVVFGAVAAGAVDFVAKPYAKDTLLAKLIRATRRLEPCTPAASLRANASDERGADLIAR